MDGEVELRVGGRRRRLRVDTRTTPLDEVAAGHPSAVAPDLAGSVELR